MVAHITAYARLRHSVGQAEEFILLRDKRLSQACLPRPTPANHVDHIKPKAKGGTGEPNNLQVLCKPFSIHQNNYRHVAQALDVPQHDFDMQCLAYDSYAFNCMLEPEMKELGLAIEIDDWLEGLRG